MRAPRASPNEGLPRTAAGATADFSSHTAPAPLTPKALEEFLDGGFSEAAVVKQVTNGKNAMPAFGGRLCRQRARHGRRARPNRLFGRGWPELGAARGMLWR